MLSTLGCTKTKANQATFCRELRKTSSLGQVFAGLNTDDPAAIRRKARQAAEQFAKLQRAAPREIRSHVTEVAKLVDKIAAAVEESPDDPQAVAKKLRGQELSSLGAARSALKLAEYSRETCHYEINGPVGTNPETSSPGASFPSTTGG